MKVWKNSLSEDTEEASEEASLKVADRQGTGGQHGPSHAGSQMSRKLKKHLAHVRYVL